MSNEVRGLILIRLKKNVRAFIQKRRYKMFILCKQIITVQYMGACSTFSLKKNVSVTRRSVTHWKFRIAACTSWRKAFDRSNIDLVARDPGISTRSFLPHFLSISTHHFGHWLQETLHHLPSNAYQTFHNRLQPWELWEEPAFFSFFQINSGRDVNDSYCHHECKVKQVGAPSLRVS